MRRIFELIETESIAGKVTQNLIRRRLISPALKSFPLWLFALALVALAVWAADWLRG